MTSTPRPRIVSAMSPVTPKPAAEFSTFAITKSIRSRSTIAGIARLAISRPDLPKMSPMKRIRTSVDPHGDAMFATAPIIDPREDDAEFPVAEPRIGARNVERSGQLHRAGEPTEYTLRSEERRVGKECSYGVAPEH